MSKSTPLEMNTNFTAFSVNSPNPRKFIQNQSIPRLFLILTATVAILAASTQAQSTWVGPSNGVWNTTSNWSAAVPDFQDSEADFTNAASVNVNALTNAVGTIVLDAANSNAVIISNGTIDLSVSFGVPTVNIANSAATLFMYANVTGAQGLRKDGPGKFTFRFNPNNQTYSGGISINGGTFGINQAGSLGDSNNDITLESSSVFRFEPGGDAGSIVLGAGNDFIINPGNTLTVQNSGTNTVNSTINGIISGDGNLTFSGSGTLTLSGTNTFTGATTVAGGTLVVNQPLAATNVTTLNNGAQLALGAGASFSTNSLIMIGAAPSTVNLGGNTQSIRSLAATNATNFPAAFTNGSLVIAGDAGQSFNTTINGGGTDMTGLANFTYNRTNRDFQVTANGANVTNTFFLAKSGTNAISATNLRLGGGGSNAVGQNTLVRLGQANVLNASAEVLFGYFQGSVNASFHAGLTNPSLTIRGAAGGTNPVPLFRVGQCNSGNQSTVGTLDLTSGSLDAVATSVDIGAHIASTGATLATGTLVMPNGTLTTPTLTIGLKTATTGNPQITGTLTQGGGTVEATTVYLGNNLNNLTNTNAIPRFVSTYNLNGGLLRAAAIAAGSGIAGTNFAINTQRRINWGGGTIRPLNAGTNLTIVGTIGGTSGGNIDILGYGPEVKTFTTDGSNSIVLAATTWLNANGGDIRIDPGTGGTFTTTGSFTVGSAQFPNTNTFFTNVINASITVASGTANLTAASRIFGIGDRTNSGITNSFNVVGGVANVGLTANRMLVGNKSTGEVNVTGGSLNITGTNAIYVGGDISFGANNAQGTWTVTGGAVNIGGSGAFVLGQNSPATNNTTSNSLGVLNLSGGTFTTTRPITTGVNTNGTTSAGTVNFNGGTLAAGTNIANLINVTTATVASNSTISTGTFDSGISQNLQGAGTLTISGNGTLRLNGTNTPPVTVNSGATLGGTGSIGNVTVNGTISPGPAATNGTLTSTASVSVPGTARFRVFGNNLNDRLITFGGTTLGGTLTVTNADGSTLTNGSTFDLIDGTISGSPTLNLPTLDPGLVWVTNNFASTGVLSVTNNSTPTNNYANWLTNYPSLTGTNALPTANPDGDPYINSTEFAFDGNPTIGTPALMTVTQVGTNAVVNWVQRKNPPGGAAYDVQKNGTLTNDWTAATGLDITNSANTNNINIPADYERKEFTVPAMGKDFYRVQATITNN